MIELLPEIRPLLADDRLNELGPGSPNLALREQLQQLDAEIAPKVRDRNLASACLAGLWLYHDFLDESHAISQDLDTIEGSYWHALMHRREPDYWNAKYWFRRVPQYPMLDELCEHAKALTNQAGVPKGCEYLVRQDSWDLFAFVDLCEFAARGPSDVQRLCRQIQRREWDLLFRHCHDRAFVV